MPKQNGEKKLRIHVEFVAPDSGHGQDLQKQYWFKEVERPNFLPRKVVDMMRSEGYRNVKQHNHTALWKERDGKNQGRGLSIDIAGTWYWYEPWLEIASKHYRVNANSYK